MEHFCLNFCNCMLCNIVLRGLKFTVASFFYRCEYILNKTLQADESSGWSRYYGWRSLSESNYSLFFLKRQLERASL